MLLILGFQKYFIDFISYKINKNICGIGFRMNYLIQYVKEILEL